MKESKLGKTIKFLTSTDFVHAIIILQVGQKRGMTHLIAEQYQMNQGQT